MERRDCLKRFAEMGFCAGALPLLASAAAPETTPPEGVEQLRGRLEFVQNWLSDLLAAMGRTLDRQTVAKLMAQCGRDCFERHAFKRGIAARGKGSLDKLIAAYKENFEIWRDGDAVHIRYGETSPGCYCPAANYRPAVADDPHCDCTRATHQAVFEAALGRPFAVEALETVRRGGRTCHFLVRPLPGTSAGVGGAFRPRS